MPIRAIVGNRRRSTHSSLAWHFFAVIHDDAFVRCGERRGALASARVQSHRVRLIDLQFVMILLDHVLLVAAARAAAAHVAVVAEWRR